MGRNYLSIQTVSSKKAKNLLRSIIAEDQPSTVKRSMAKLRGCATESDYKKSINILRSHPLFESNGLSREFPTTFLTGNLEYPSYSTDEIVLRINDQSDRLAELVEMCSDLVASLFQADYESALNQCESLASSGGVSGVLLRTLVFLSNRFEEDTKYGAYSDRLDAVFNKLLAGNVRYLHDAVLQLSSYRTDYFSISRRIMNGDEGNWKNTIARDMVDHVFRSEGEFNRKLNAYYSLSLLDACLYLASSQRITLTPAMIPLLASRDLEKNIQKIFRTAINENIFLEESEGEGYGAFREGFLLIELNDFFYYRTVHGTFHNESNSKQEERTPIVRQLINDYFGSLSDLDELCFEEPYSLNWSTYSNRGCSYLENTSALLFLLEKNNGDITGSEKEFVSLMSHTRDVGIVCPKQYLFQIGQNASTSELSLVVACLKTIKENTQVSEHSLRKILQEICVGEFDSSLIELVKYLYQISPTVTEHLIGISTETFLSKLFFLTDRPNRAVEVRADLLEWYGRKVDENSYIEKARNLKIDVQISKEKGTIDDSRIYVDPIKYAQWISDAVLNDLIILLTQECGDVEMNDCSVDWKNASRGLQAKDQIASFLLSCYHEFCVNKLFGIASYLGRRIRHGTFEGTAMKEVKEFRTSEDFQQLFSDHDFCSLYNEWVDKYSRRLAELKIESLHINSKTKPHGLIFDSLNSGRKVSIASRMYVDVYNSFVRDRNGIRIPYIITEYCWMLIEEDLLSIRRVLMQSKSEVGVFRFPNSLTQNLDRRVLGAFTQELNSVTADKFRLIESWFNKPSIASPSTDLVLLLRAVVSEVKGFFPNYDPILKFEEAEFRINGGQYFAIYDALYVLIYNAAKYGKKDGQLASAVKFIEELSVMRVEIVSEVDRREALEESRVRIEKSLSRDFSDAHVVEGESGIKKLRQLEKDGYISSINYEFSLPATISASFDSKLLG